MKIEIVKKGQVNQQIDWSEPMIVKCKVTGIILFTTGEHGDKTFSGIAFENEYVVYLTDWVKDSFYPITEPVTIKFIP